MSRRDFGSIRRRDNGRWQARYRDPNGRVHNRMFATRGDAARYLAGIRADLDRGDWFDPSAGRVPLRDYADAWLKTRRVRGRPLAPRTVVQYRWQLDKHMLPSLGDHQLRQLSSAVIREWHLKITSANGPGAVTAAKCYRLLHTICASAVSDQEIARNPCTIPGAGLESSPERPTATIPQVLALAAAVGDRWRTLVLLAAFCSLRMGELAALTRRDIDLDTATVTVRASAADLPGGHRHIGPPKSEAGRRTVTIPEAILDAVTEHLDTYADPGLDGLVFRGPRGGVLRDANFVNDVWRPATRDFGLEHLHFHDLRHTGNTLAAATGASLRELMVRMGHASPKAALRYQHATRDRDAAIAAALSALVEQSQPAVPLARATDDDRQTPKVTERCGPDVAQPRSPRSRRAKKTPSDLGKHQIDGQDELSFPS
jgi:integrase